MTSIPPIDWGELRRLSPISHRWGFDRGRPADRYYIEKFLVQHRADVTGCVLEVKDSGYTDRFGVQVTRSDVLDVDPGNSRATIVADLARADGIPADTFDCFILTQTLHMIYDMRAALSHACRILKPGGVLLWTLPAVSRIDYELENGDFWRFTGVALRRLFAEVFPTGNVEVSPFGNVLICTAFLYGIAFEELTAEELDSCR